MKFSAFILGLTVFLSVSKLANAQSRELGNSGQGTFQLKWEPKSCITDPCPQFNILKFGGKAASGIAADIDRGDFQKSPMANFQTFFVQGSYERDAQHPEYVKIQVKKWYGIVKEDFSTAPSKR